MDNTQARREQIEAGRCSLGIELGSTRIKAVLIGEDHTPLAQGGHGWENRLENGLWTYSLEDVWQGLSACYTALAEDVRRQYGCALTRLRSMGVSAMMHGYMAFNEEGQLLAPFRTWRNTNTDAAARELTALLDFNIPHRWSIAHLDQAILNGEQHVGDIRFLTTLAGYVHWQLTGEKVLGVGDAAGMFPIDSAAGTYDAGMLAKYQQRVAPHGFGWTLAGILPRVLPAGADAGRLSEAGALRLDPTGALQPGVPLCPPEGDAGTGMAATNSVAPRTGNVSAGTSIFAMVVLEKPLSRVYPQIDMVTTPSGAPVAMVHCNNCTCDIDAWVGVFGEFAHSAGATLDTPQLYDLLYESALAADADAGGLVAYNFLAGEPVLGLEQGVPMLLRAPGSRLSLGNLMRCNLYAALAALRLGLAILVQHEGVKLQQLLGHGGLYKTPLVGQRMTAAAAGVPVAVMQTAGEGGAWGIALLAAYRTNRAQGESLEDYLAQRVFAGDTGSCVQPLSEDVRGFDAYMRRYELGLAAERAAADALH